MKPEHQLLEKAEQIEELVWQMLEIIKENFPSQYDDAYQHWTPQILTALFDYPYWLKRGQFNLNDTLKNIGDLKSTNIESTSVHKFI
jgi:hypothetical protein